MTTCDPAGDWMQTYSGLRFWPLEPRAEDVRLVDIAQSLARICRFGGHVLFEHYSVAQHSVLVASLVPPEVQASALLHDAAEAYLGDVIRPLKRSSLLKEGYAEAERRVALVIGNRFGVDLVTLHPAIKVADDIVLATERRDVVAAGPGWNLLTRAPMEEHIEAGWGAHTAADAFLAEAQRLGLEGP